ncbi:MAG TPA: peptide MFS transporter [Gemmatimonadaceae bacterium]|jgi:POT family proton-dependent oligopeptide transporter
MAKDESVFSQPQAGSLTHDEPPAGLEKWTGNRSFFGHPRGLATLFLMEMWERFSYYGIRPLLVLFMSAALLSGGFGYDRTVASSIVGIYAASVYLASLPGGWIADRWLGLQRSIWWGGVLIACGHIAIASSIVLSRTAFFVGLVLIVIGTGLLKPNISATVGDLYPEGGARRDAGFSIFYMGINTGALIAPLITGYLGERVGWHWGFGAAGLGMIIGLITYRARVTPTLGPIGALPTASPEEQRRVRSISIACVIAIIALIVLVATGIIHINPVVLAERMGAVLLSLAVIYFAYLFFFAHLTTGEKKRVAVIVVLFVFATIFWAAFEQAPTSLNLFALDFTDRNIHGWQVPATWFQSAESFFVITLAPVFAWIWVALAKRKLDFSSPTKFAIGLAFCAASFGVMLMAANRIIAGSTAGATLHVSMLWLVVCYMFQAFGELCLSPVGLSSMTKLAPRRFVGQMMGIWFLADSLGNLIAGLVGGHVNANNLAAMPQLFQRTALSLLVAAIVCAALIIPIRKMMEEKPA